MKQIQPVSIWGNGTTEQAEILNVYGINLQLGKSADFYYSISSKNSNADIGIQLAQGNLSMNDEEYNEWGNDDDYVWEFVATKLNLTIIGDWVKPETESEV
jgi:hypothetical protein